MWTGKQTLHSINQALTGARREVDELDSELGYYTQRLAEIRREQANAYQQFARVRLEDITQDSSGADLANSLESADAMALDALQQRQAAFQQLEEQIGNRRADLEALEQERDQAALATEQGAEKLIELESKAQARLDENSEYKRQLRAAKRADAIAARAEEKNTTTEQDRRSKGKPYEDDELFMYLWNRHYGTPEYQANPLTRYLDERVARLCGFNEARVNYWTLLEIPRRVAAHAALMREKAEQEVEKLGQQETEVAAQFGVDQQQQRVNALQQVVDELDQRQDGWEASLHGSLRERAAYAAGEDLHFRQAVDILAGVARRKDVSELQHLARSTLHRQDDDLVAEIGDLRGEEQDLQAQLKDHRRHQDDRLQRLKGLEQVRSQFKHSRFDDVRSGFNNENLISMALGEFMKGLLNSNELWNTINRHQRHRDVGAWPDFGSGGLTRSGRRNRHSPWHWPGGGSGGGFRLPGSGGPRSRGGGGGFRTGGGF